MVLRTLPALAAGLVLTNAAVPVAAQKSTDCSGGWAGTVQYSRNQSQSDSKVVQRVTGKGTENINWSLTYDYSAQVAVRATPNPYLSEARANITVAGLSRETKTAQDRYICRNEKTYRQMSGSFVSTTKTSANGSGLEADVSVSLDNDGRYTVSVILPEVQGKVSGSNSASYSGQCTAKKGVNNSIPETPTTIDGVRFSSSGEDRADPADMNRLSGSHSTTSFGVTETLKWSLRRCAGSLRLVDVKFADMKYPNWGAWQEISEQRGTIDGNVVRFTAVVANDGSEEENATVKFVGTFKGDKWDGSRPDDLLGEGEVAIPAGEEREVHFEWDSSGYAWYDDGRPRLVQRIRAELDDGGKKVDEKTENLKVAPKPLVLVHGLWSNWKAWESWQNILTTAHSYDWKAFPVGQQPQFGRMNTGEEVGNIDPTNTIAQNADELARYIKYAQRDRNAWHVDIVAHSMGGLISRRYIHATMPAMPDGKPQVAHLVMLGTPNMGSYCADLASWPLETLGRSMEALRELKPSVVEQFNAMHTLRKDVRFSVLAGDILPDGCYAFEDNDGVVTVPSAIWTIEDNEQKSVLHTDMTGTAEFSSFVKPRLALGPGQQGRHPEQAALTSPFDGGTQIGRPSSVRLLLTGVEDPRNPAEVAPDFADVVKLEPKSTVIVELPVKAARSFGVTFVAAGTVSATLFDDKGAVVKSNLSGSPEAGQIFRSMSVSRPVEQGTWTLKLENTGETAREAIVSTWSSPN